MPQSHLSSAMDDNPYKPPQSCELLSCQRVGDAVLYQLIAGVETEDIVVYDVSDCQLYGRKGYRQLTGELGQAAQAVGCEAEVFQSVYWLTLAYFPITPLGVYLVMPRQTCDDPDGDAEQYRAVKIPVDRWQIAAHYAIAFLLLLVVAGIIVWLASLRFRASSGLT